MDKFPLFFSLPLGTRPPAGRDCRRWGSPPRIVRPIAPTLEKNEGGRGVVWFWYFLIYSFIGFLIEVCYVRVAGEPKRDRKCRLLLPICPVYGLGALGLLLLPEPVQASPLLLFPAAALVCTGVEWLTGSYYEKVFRVCFWDYSHLPLHLGRHACLRFALYWGALAVLIHDLLHPWVVRLVMRIPFWLAPPAAALLLVDTLLTAALLRRTRDTGALRWYLRLTRRRPA